MCMMNDVIWCKDVCKKGDHILCPFNRHLMGMKL